MKQAICAVLVGLALWAMLVAFNRIRILRLSWPKTESPMKAAKLCAMYFTSRGWCVQPRGAAEEYLEVKQGDFGFLVFVRPHGWRAGAAFLQRAERLRHRDRVPVVIVTIDPVAEVAVNIDPGEVLIVCYKDLGEVEEVLSWQCGSGMVPHSRHSVAGLLQALLGKSAYVPRLKASAGKRLPRQTSANSYTTIRQHVTSGADFVFEPTHKGINLRPFFPRLQDCQTGIDELGHAVLQLSGGAANASSGGRTEGFVIGVPDSFEKAASGRKVLFRVIARAGGIDASARFALAYSTNEVGNSGWRWFEAGQEWSVFETTYSVPPMQAGKGDFIGLLPGEPGSPHIEIGCVAAAVLKDED